MHVSQCTLRFHGGIMKMSSYAHIRLLCLPWCNSPYWARVSSLSRLHEHRHSTLGSTPLDEWSTHHRNLNVTKQTFMSPAGFQPAILARERPQTHALRYVHTFRFSSGRARAQLGALKHLRFWPAGRTNKNAVTKQSCMHSDLQWIVIQLLLCTCCTVVVNVDVTGCIGFIQ